MQCLQTLLDVIQLLPRLLQMLLECLQRMGLVHGRLPHLVQFPLALPELLFHVLQFGC